QSKYPHLTPRQLQFVDEQAKRQAFRALISHRSTRSQAQKLSRKTHAFAESFQGRYSHDNAPCGLGEVIDWRLREACYIFH
ncbi:hypothetical protein BaRGS_00006582, partial [Batillaria attramentaria]